MQFLIKKYLIAETVIDQKGIVYLFFSKTYVNVI